jgi:D-xylonolactonase
MTMTAEMIADYACATGENPLWHTEEESLYWTDIPTGQLFRYAAARGEHEQIYSGRRVGGFTFQEGGGLLLFMDRGTIALWKDGALTELVEDIAAERESRFNDVIADPRGRVFCGTMSTDAGSGDASKGRLYRLDGDGSLHVVLEGIGCANGMAFTPDRRGFYFTDSFAREIYLFDYEEATGAISNRRVFARLAESDGLPDGMTIDGEGRVWSALWDGRAIVRFSEQGEIVERYALPVPKVSSLTFAGEGLSELYITTAGGDQKEVDGPLAGALFRMKTPYRGLAEFRSRVVIPGRPG